MIHPLCDQIVTLYRQSLQGLQRRVVSGCFYSWRRQQTPEGLTESKFLLVLPAGEDIEIGDRVYDGIGPETVVWEQFLPINTPGLSQVAYVMPCYFRGALHHTEAGRK